MLDALKAETPRHVLEVAEHVWQRRQDFVRWPQRAFCFMPGCVRIPYHVYSPEQKAQLRNARIAADNRSNGPAILAFLLAGGERPVRQAPGKRWSVHHIYDGKFPAPGRSATIHAVKEGPFFTEAAGLVAVHPIADALADEVPYFAWLLRKEAFDRFGFDPDSVFRKSSAYQIVGRCS